MCVRLCSCACVHVRVCPYVTFTRPSVIPLPCTTHQTDGLTAQSEPEIYAALRFGAVCENVALDPATRVLHFDDTRLTKNGRASYPLSHIRTARIPSHAAVPTSIVLLICDAFGLFPAVSRLSLPQALYHFLSGHTSRHEEGRETQTLSALLFIQSSSCDVCFSVRRLSMPHTEVGVIKPVAIFSACFGEPFLLLHPVELRVGRAGQGRAGQGTRLSPHLSGLGVERAQFHLARHLP